MQVYNVFWLISPLSFYPHALASTPSPFSTFMPFGLVWWSLGFNLGSLCNSVMSIGARWALQRLHKWRQRPPLKSISSQYIPSGKWRALWGSMIDCWQAQPCICSYCEAIMVVAIMHWSTLRLVFGLYHFVCLCSPLWHFWDLPGWYKMPC